MTRIYFSGIDATTTENEYTMTEISAADHGEEWNGDTLGYIQNLDLDSDYTVGSENDLGNVHQSFGGLDPIPGSIIVLLQDDVPVLVYWASEVTASWLPDVMTVDEYIQNLMDNDEENIRHMTEEQAADILDWTRGDDEDGKIPADLTASELARRWNEIKGTAGISKRYEAMEEGEDLNWCRCYHGTAPDGTDCHAVIHEGKVSAVRIGSETVDYVTDPADVKRFVSAACPTSSDYSGYSDEYIITSTLTRCGCRSCPWRDMCDAMDDID